MTTHAERLAARQARRPEFDPYITRARGRAIQGNTPFDVTWISEIEGNLHMGGVIPGRPLPLMPQPDIDALIAQATTSAQTDLLLQEV